MEFHAKNSLVKIFWPYVKPLRTNVDVIDCKTNERAVGTLLRVVDGYNVSQSIAPPHRFIDGCERFPMNSRLLAFEIIVYKTRTPKATKKRRKEKLSIKANPRVV
jgi:hypothetical protein